MYSQRRLFTIKIFPSHNRPSALMYEIFIVKENLPIGKPLGVDRGLVALMGIRIFINSDPMKKPTLFRSGLRF